MTSTREEAPPLPGGKTTPWTGRLRLSGRAVAAAASTAGYLAGLEIARSRRPDEATTLVHSWVPRWASSLLDLFGVALRAEGPYTARGAAYPGQTPGGPGRLFVMNHRSAVDILVVLATTEAHLVSRHDLAAWPGIGLGARRIGTMFVDRASMRSGATVLKEMTRGLKAGRGVAIFPEGTAFAGDEVRPFRPGAFKASIRTGAEIVPMGIAYADPAAHYGDESFGAHVARIGAMRRLEVALVFGEPIGPQGKKLVDLRDETHTAVQALVDRARTRLT